MDMSLDLLMRGLWARCKEVTALAIALLNEDASPSPALIGYSEIAHELEPSEMEALEVDYVYGTNVQHALQLAKSYHPQRVLFVADTEPTAHMVDDRDPFFMSPPIPETAERTLGEAQDCSTVGIRLDFLLLRAESEFRGLASELARECQGTVGTLSGSRDEVEVQDFLSTVGL